MKKLDLKVKGMVCSGCENRVKNALKNIEGVTKVNANHKTGLVTVNYKDETDTNLFTQVISDLGYEIEE